MERDLTIACGNSCTDTHWKNQTFRWNELYEKLETTIRTTETVKEYPRLSKEDRARAKDKGGFVGGRLTGYHRKRETLQSRSVLTLDADQAEVGFIDRFSAECKYAACLYTTHSHTPEAPRCRIVVPLTRDVTPDEYVAVARYFAAEWGIDQFDECSYRPHQMMYWPTTPSDGEYICKVVEGEWLDPDVYLSARPEWKDYSRLPISSRENPLRDNGSKKQEDPLTKPGVVGAFCRAYGISAAIEKFLPDVYAPSAVEGRYDYIPADSSAGVVVYDDKYAYSHHATDPACGVLCNAFDLVRLHRFGNEDEKESFKKMSEFAVKDDSVKVQLAADHAVQSVANVLADGEDWKKMLTYAPRSGELQGNIQNLNLILQNDPELQNFGYNEMSNRIQVTGTVPWDRPLENSYWRDADTAQLKSYIDDHYGAFPAQNFDVSFAKAVDDRRFHPIREYLGSLPAWDGKKRIEEIFIRCLQADDTEYVRTVTRKFFAAAVGRILCPGVKFDSILVLDGEQGIGKSTIFKDLVGSEYYSETLSLTDMNDKSGAEKLQGFWIIEIAELAGMKKADIEKVKSFLSTSDDKYRPSYGKMVESHPRQCVIIGTVNGERGYLRDITGNRRFWIVKVHQVDQKKSWSFSKEEKDQIWAEAKALWEAGEKLYLEGDMIKEAEKEQVKAMEVDERTGSVEEYLDKKLPKNWGNMDLYERRRFLDDKNESGTEERTTVSNMEIWCECFGKNQVDIKTADSYAIKAIMLQIPGWKQVSTPKRIPIYGKQRLYEKVS